METSRRDDADSPAYRDRTLGVEERTSDLLKRMTVEEKVAQLRNLFCPWPEFTHKERGRLVVTEKLRSVLSGPGVGALQGLVRTDFWTQRTLESGFNRREGAEIVNIVQRLAIENSRLGIPLLLMDDSRHGQHGIGATVFPCGITLSCAWNPSLLKRVGNAIGRELRSQGQTVAIAPHLNLARDPRWSRMEETYGEDPFLAGRLGAAFVTGLQDEGEQRALQAIAAVCMFGGMGDCEGGQDGRPVHVGRRELKEVLLRPFAAAVKAGALGAMASYSDVDGVPCHANKELLSDILRGEWGFRGFIEADGNGVHYLHSRWGVAADLTEAAAMGIRTGLDMDLYVEKTKSYEVYAEALPDALQRGLVSMEDIDRSVTRILRVKFMLGLFENPYADPDQAVCVARSAEHLGLALEAAREGIVLLKNDKGILPLSKKIGSIAVIGPSADDPGNQLGDYTPATPRENVITILDGIRARVSPDTKVRYARGCGIKDPSREGFTEAIAAAGQSDLVVVAVGGSSKREYKHTFNDVGTGVVDGHVKISDIDCGEGITRATLNLLGVQRELLEEIKQTGKPVVVVLIHGRPVSIPHVAEIADAVIDAWYPGEQGGTAVAEVLFGDYNPAGRLSVSVPRHVGQLPVYYNTRRPRRRDYIDMPTAPLYPFGHGLSYTTFTYENLQATPDAIPVDGTATVSVDVTNTGKIAGDEVVQMYVRDEHSSVVRPLLELKGFERVHLAPGESRQVAFSVGWDELCFCGPDMDWVVEAGEFTIMIGGNSVQHLTALLTVQ